MSVDTSSLKQYKLFGGAIKVSLPPDLVDASDIRQVPDTQEVWLSKDSDISYVVEILERVDQNDGLEAAKFHFNSLAHDNDATSTSIEKVLAGANNQTAPSPPAQPSSFSLIGTQRVPKFNKRATQADLVKIFLTVWRVDAKNTDVVLSINVPVTTGSGGPGVGEDGAAWAEQVWEHAKATFVIDDFGLFA